MGVFDLAKRREILDEIEQTMGFVPAWMMSLPQDMLEVEWHQLKNWEMQDTPIPRKFKELIGLAVAAQAQCPYTVAFHTELARLHGADQDEIMDALHMAKTTAGWSTYFQGSQSDLVKFKREIREVCDTIAAKAKAA